MLRHEGMLLSLEVIVASLADRSTLRYFVRKEDITRWESDPDEIVQELLQSPEYDISTSARQNCIVHSTSWRFEPHQTIVLTYFVYSDLPMFRKNSGKLLSLHDAAISGGDDPAKPRPARIDEEHVVTHGIRHISHLVKEGSQNMLRILTPESIKAFQTINSLLAGRLR
jgi:hypothetical protein